MPNQITRGNSIFGGVKILREQVVGDNLSQKTARVRVTASDIADNTEVDTGWDLPASAVVTSVLLHVVTAESTATTKTLDVGLLSSETNGDANGFLAGADVSGTGFVLGTLDSGGQTLGALLTSDESGAGVLVPEPHTVDQAVSLSVTGGDAGGFSELVADIYVEYLTINNNYD